MLTYQISIMTIEKYPPDILIQVSRNSCGTFDFYKAEELVEIGRHAAIERLRSCLKFILQFYYVSFLPSHCYPPQADASI